MKREARAGLLKDYSSDLFPKKEVERVLDSIADANNYIAFNVAPVERWVLEPGGGGGRAGGGANVTQTRGRTYARSHVQAHAIFFCLLVACCVPVAFFSRHARFFCVS